MSESSKPTPGPWRPSAYQEGVFGAVRGNGMEPIGCIYTPSFADRSEVGKRALADLHLITEAGTVFHETGLTPRGLVDLLYRALPFIEDAKEDPCYRDGYAKSLDRDIRAALTNTERKTS